TPMHQAARWEKNIEYLKEYFASGGDVNLKDSSWFYPEYAGNTLLHDAVEGGNIEAVKLLIENEADLNRLSNAGRAPMDLAVKLDDNALADLLRKNGAKTAGELKAEGK
ncbi:ankyrin repeat domain-containing protein, partial [Akkermansiaceae bacterium]|nr:ankyrin repeat domain-containing protein [Akkermansiaceae bacterium]